jgi:hypothetical protein
MTRQAFAALAVALVVVMGVSWIVGGTSPVVAIENARVLRSLRTMYKPDYVRSFTLGWDNGWASACEASLPPSVYSPASPEARRSALIAATRVGDFGTAARLAGLGTSAGPDSDRAYAAFLSGDWLAAAQATRGTPAGIPDPVWGTILYLAGQEAFALGDTATADALLQRSDALVGEAGPMTSTHLAHCLERWGRPADALAERRRAATQRIGDDATPTPLARAFLPPSVELGASLTWVPAAQAQPRYVLARPGTGRWSLFGLDINQTDLAHLPVLRVATYWRTVDRPDEVAIERTIVRDLVANGALEWDHAAPAGRPFGFPGSVYRNAVPLTIEQQPGRGSVLCITRPADGAGVGVEGLDYALARTNGVTLVVGGDVVTYGGSGFTLGARWFGSQEPTPFEYIGQAMMAPSEWTTYVGALPLQAGAHTVRLWLQNVYGPAGARTCFDNMFMFELHTPA